MKLRRLGKTGLQVSEIGFGAEWLERHPEEEGVELIHYAADAGINIKYMYGLSTGDTGASIAFKTDDLEGTEKALEPLEVQYYTPESLENVE